MVKRGQRQYKGILQREATREVKEPLRGMHLFLGLLFSRSSCHLIVWGRHPAEDDQRLGDEEKHGQLNCRIDVKVLRDKRKECGSRLIVTSTRLTNERAHMAYRCEHRKMFRDVSFLLHHNECLHVI